MRPMSWSSGVVQRVDGRPAGLEHQGEQHEDHPERDDDGTAPQEHVVFGTREDQRLASGRVEAYHGHLRFWPSCGDGPDGVGVVVAARHGKFFLYEFQRWTVAGPVRT